MATKKKPTAKPSRTKPPAPPVKKSLAATGAARKPAFSPAVADEALDEPLLDVSGVFHAVSDLETSQRGGDEDEASRFPDHSLVIEAKSVRDEVPDAGDSGAFDPETLLDDAQRAARRQRVAQLVAQKRR